MPPGTAGGAGGVNPPLVTVVLVVGRVATVEEPGKVVLLVGSPVLVVVELVAPVFVVEIPGKGDPVT